MTTRSICSVSPQEAHARLQGAAGEYALVDVRTRSEFESLHALPALLLPLSNLTEREMEQLSSKKILCICQTGARGRQAADIFAKNGFKEVYNVEGGTAAWAKDGLPVVRGTSNFSLERQVRIVAGTLVAIGTLAGFFLTPYLLFIPLIVGSGLVFSAITDTCGMALVLTRCPWNAK